MCVLLPITSHAVNCNDCAADWLKKPKSVQIALVCLSNKLKSIAAAIENMHQSFGDIAQPQH
jgi:hypothetical protein